MQFYTDSINYHATIHQSGRALPWLLMLHGFMGSEEVFEPLIQPLSRFCNPVTIDLAGHGKTKTPVRTELFSAERQCLQLKSILYRLQVENLFLYGYSMGGRLAFQMAAKYPGLFRGVIIESAHCGILEENERQKRINTDKKRAQKIERNFADFLNDWQKMPLFQHTTESEQNRYERIMKSQNPELMAASLRGFGAGVMPPVCESFSKSKLPACLIAGERDVKYAEQLSELADKRPGTNLHIIKSAGHRVHTDQPEKLISVLSDFIHL